MAVHLLFARWMGVTFMVAVLITLTVNYSLAVGCGDRCFSESESPIIFPDHIYISDTFRKGPTRYIGIAGFSIAAVSGVMVGLLRYFQIKRLAMKLEPEEIKNNVLRKNQASLKYLFAFGASLVGLTVVPPADLISLQTVVHYLFALCTIVCFLLFIILQLNRVEGTLISLPVQVQLESGIQISMLTSDAQCPSDCWQSYMFKKKCLSALIALGVCFLLSMLAWLFLKNPQPFFVAISALCLTLELLAVIAASCFVGLTDFPVIEKQYGHFLQNKNSELTLQNKAPNDDARCDERCYV